MTPHISESESQSVLGLDRKVAPDSLYIYIRPFIWLEIDAVYKLGNNTLVSTTLCPQYCDLDKQPITVTGLAM